MANKLKSVPSVIQLPGGVKLSGVKFRITERDEAGCPKTFEILPPGAESPKTDGCVLFADENWIRSPG